MSPLAFKLNGATDFNFENVRFINNSNSETNGYGCIQSDGPQENALLVNNCMFDSNTAQHGSGIHNDASTLNITNSKFTNNGEEVSQGVIFASLNNAGD